MAPQMEERLGNREVLFETLSGKQVSRCPRGLKYDVRPTRSHECSWATGSKTSALASRSYNGLTIYSHNQLYGRWYTVRRPRMPRTGRQLRIELRTRTHKALLYSASDIDVLDDDQLLKHPFLSRVGPDILDRALTKAHVVERLCDPAFRNRSLGSLYLDQRFLAGNGNYLRSDTRGVTVAPALATKLKADGLGYAAYRFYVFGREGRPCRRCESPIERRTMGSRNLFTCPTCQPAGTCSHARPANLVKCLF
jgi:endonuclease-8